MKKRLLSLLLSMAMILGLLPGLTVSAADGVEATDADPSDVSLMYAFVDHLHYDENGNGVCDYSGCSATVEAAPEIDPINVAGSNMTLGNQLEVNFLVKQADLSGTGYTAVVTQTLADGTERVTELAQDDWGEMGSSYHKISIGVAAKEMADALSLEIKDDNGNVYNNAYSTSVREYAGKALASSAMTAEVKTMMVDMVNYGAAAQMNFNYNTSDLANNALTDEQKAMATPTVTCTNRQVKGTNFYGSNLSLEDSILLNVYFSGLNGKDVSTMYATVAFNGYDGVDREVTVPGTEFEAYGSSGDIYKIIVDDIVLADAGRLVTVTVYNADGTEHGSGSDSVESYAARAASVDTNGLYAGIMKFAASAFVYVGGVEEKVEKEEEEEVAFKSGIVVIDGDSWISKDGYATAEGMHYKTNLCDFVLFEEGAPIKTFDTSYEFNMELASSYSNEDTLAWVEYTEDGEVLMQSGRTANVAYEGICLKKGSVKLVDQNGSIVSSYTDEVGNYIVTDNTKIIVRVPDYSDEGGYIYRYFDGINDLDATYAADSFQYFINSDLDFDANGAVISYIYLDATCAMEEHAALLLRPLNTETVELSNGETMDIGTYAAIVDGVETVVAYDLTKAAALGTLYRRDLFDVDGDGYGDQVFVPMLIYSETVQIGLTVDGVPVWGELSIDNYDMISNFDYNDPKFSIDGNVLYYRDCTSTSTDIWSGTSMDEDCAVWLLLANEDFEFVPTLVTPEQFNIYWADRWVLVDGSDAWAIDVKTESGYGDGKQDSIMMVMAPADMLLN